MPTPAADPEQQRIAQEQEAARTSHLFATTNAGQVTAGGLARPDRRDSRAAPAAGSSDLTSQDHKLAFLNGNVDRRTVSPDRVEPPPVPYVLQAGAVIPAALITGLRSDLPGQVTAQVTEDVYDSPTGKFLLIPQGARLVGQYDAQIAFGQIAGAAGLEPPDHAERPLDRAGASARRRSRRLCRPGGRGRQSLGHAVQGRDPFDLLSVGSEAGTSGNEQQSSPQAIRQGASQSFNQTGEQVVGRSLNIQPTITIRPGFPVRVMVTHDLVLEPYRA